LIYEVVGDSNAVAGLGVLLPLASHDQGFRASLIIYLTCYCNLIVATTVDMLIMHSVGTVKILCIMRHMQHQICHVIMTYVTSTKCVTVNYL
jgi:hypothetical protein